MGENIKKQFRRANMQTWVDATEMAQAVTNKEISAVELVENAIQTVKRLNPRLNAVVHLQEERALLQAREACLANKPFSGVPLLLKDLGQNQKGEPSTSGARLLKKSIQKENDFLVSRLESLGFIIIGRTNTPEFGFKNITDSHLWGNAVNPIDLNRNAGGSSGGAAAAVASGMVPIAMASDGGGSIRIPASFTGTIGLKPSRGRIIVGPTNYRGWQGASVHFAITKTLRDTQRLLEALQVEQFESPFILPKLSSKMLKKNNPSKLKIAYHEHPPISTAVSSQAAKQALRQTLKILESMGHIIEEVEWPINGEALMQSYYMMNCVETSVMMTDIERLVGRKLVKEDMEPLSWAIYRSGEKVLAKDYATTLKKWDDWSAVMHRFHQQYDLFVTPTTSDVAPLIIPNKLHPQFATSFDQIEELSFKQQQQLIWDLFESSLTLTPFTQLANITGQPALSLPLYQTEKGLPIGVQFMAAKGREDLLLQLGKALKEQFFCEL